ncbi:MAG: hypothetical protein ACXWBP_12170 [Limisphaerales bacterium]
MAVTSHVYFASDEQWYVQYVSRVGEAERQWTEGPYRWRWLARLDRTLAILIWFRERFSSGGAVSPGV